MPESSNEIQSATASMNNEDQNTQKESHIPGGNENKNDKLVIEITEMVERPEIQSPKQCLIYKVLPQLRKWNEAAYTPQVISIGPIHHNNDRLKAMEEHKQRFFRSFVKRNKIELVHLVRTIREMEESIRGCYAETFDISSNVFVKMIVVDAGFILENLCGYGVLGQIPRATAVMFDLLLLENQLPFFVIEKLHQLAFPSLSDADLCHDLVKLSLNYFSDFNIQFIQARPNMNIEHFTDLLRTFQLPEKLPRRSYQQIHLFHTATQLHKAGVKFNVGINECCFDIKFEKGVLEIPRLELMDCTEVVTRNIMALEQTHYIEAAYFTDYFIMMGLLIDAREDVDMLCDKKILFNYLGDNNAAKSMIKNLNNGIVWTNMRNDYIDLCKELNGFYENPWHRLMATRRQFFVTSASIVTVLTFIQTFCSIIQLSK